MKKLIPACFLILTLASKEIVFAFKYNDGTVVKLKGTVIKEHFSRPRPPGIKGFEGLTVRDVYGNERYFSKQSGLFTEFYIK